MYFSKKQTIVGAKSFFLDKNGQETYHFELRETNFTNQGLHFLKNSYFLPAAGKNEKWAETFPWFG